MPHPHLLPFLLLSWSLTACAPQDEVIGRSPQGKADVVGSCQEGTPNSCGGQAASGTCFCDDECANFGDCCTDYESVCEDGPTSCQSPHQACTLGDGDGACWEFGPNEGLAFEGTFRPECDENTTCLIGECAFNAACGSDAPCPGLCVLPECTAQAASCESTHETCTLGDGDGACWDFGANEGLAFEGTFRPECDENTTTCLIGECAFNPACGLDAPCPGLCVQSECSL